MLKSPDSYKTPVWIIECLQVAAVAFTALSFYLFKDGDTATICYFSVYSRFRFVTSYESYAGCCFLKNNKQNFCVESEGAVVISGKPKSVLGLNRLNFKAI